MSEDGGFFGKARTLLTRVVEKGLHLPNAAKGLLAAPPPPEREVGAPVPTVTLAQLFHRQGHDSKALALLELVLEDDPSNREARALRATLRGEPPPEGPAPEASEAPSAEATEGTHGRRGPPPEPLGIEDDFTVLLPEDKGHTFLLQWAISDEAFAQLYEESTGEIQSALAVCCVFVGDTPRAETSILAGEVLGRAGALRVTDVPNGVVLRIASGVVVDGTASRETFRPTSHASLLLRGEYSDDLYEWRADGLTAVELGAGDFPEVDALAACNGRTFPSIPFAALLSVHAAASASSAPGRLTGDGRES